MMDVDDFPTSPSKRQRTQSPIGDMTDTEIEHTSSNMDASINPAQSTPGDPHSPQNDMTMSEKDPESVESASKHEDDHGFLDVLMQHVEAETGPTISTGSAEREVQDTKPDNAIDHRTELEIEQDKSTNDTLLPAAEMANIQASLTTEKFEVSNDSENREMNGHIPKPHDTTLEDGDIPQEQQVRQSITEIDQEKLEAESANIAIAPEPRPDQVPNNQATGIAFSEEVGEDPEWEVDSSPYDSDSDSSSDESSSEESDEGSDADGDYAMLDPEEQARILMQGDAASDEEDGKSKAKGGSDLRTKNEKPEEIIPKPDIEVTENMEIEELGNVQGIVEATVLIKAKITGEYQVLEAGSLLCLKDRSVVGVVAETLGRVEQPMYTVRFTNDQDIKEAGLETSGTTLYYVKQHSKFVFTQPLKGIKGSDASNFHDEEVGEDEMEFSDDEAEAAHKRQLKLKRQGRRDDGPNPRNNRNVRGGGRPFRGGHTGPPPDSNGTAYGNGSLEMNYDDVQNNDDDDYTPLSRPSNMYGAMSSNESREAPHLTHPLLSPPISSQGGIQPRGRDRGRGNRGRGTRGGRGGNFQLNRPNNHFNTPPQQSNQLQYPEQFNYQGQSMRPPPPPPPSFAFQQQQQQHQYHQHPNQPPPNAPVIPPHHSPPYQSTPFSPSPISPLPQQHFQFGSYNPSGQPMQQYQYQNQGYNQNYQPYQQQNPSFNQGQWSNHLNHAAAAEVQRQLEELSRQK